MVAANKLVHLVEAFSTPWFLFSSPTNPQLVFSLLEVFNNVIQYQFDGMIQLMTLTLDKSLSFSGNSNLIYTIIRKRTVFYQLSNLPTDAQSIAKTLSGRKNKGECTRIDKTLTTCHFQQLIAMRWLISWRAPRCQTLQNFLPKLPHQEPQREVCFCRFRRSFTKFRNVDLIYSKHNDWPRGDSCTCVYDWKCRKLGRKTDCCKQWGSGRSFRRMDCNSGVGGRLEVQTPVANYHATSASSCATSWEDLHWQVSCILYPARHAIFQRSNWRKRDSEVSATRNSSGPSSGAAPNCHSKIPNQCGN